MGLGTLPLRLHVVASAGLFAVTAVLCARMAWAEPTTPEGSTATPASTANDPNLGARAKYDAGTSAFADGRFVEAALDFEAAARERPNAVALYTAALSWEKANVPDRAADDYARVVAMGGLPPDESERATQRLGSLESVLGAVLVTGGAEETRVQLDANTEVQAPAKLHAAAGLHKLVVRATGHPLEHMSIALARGTTTKVDLALAGVQPSSMQPSSAQPPSPSPPLGPEPPGSAVQPEAPTERSARSTAVRSALGFAALGAGATALLAGALLGVEALSARDAYNAAPTAAAYDHTSGLQTWTNAAFVSGGVLAAAGLVLVLWPVSPTSTSSRASSVHTSGAMDGTSPALPGRGRNLVLGASGRGIRLSVDF